MATLTEVRRWDPVALETAFTGFGAARDRLLDADTDLQAARPAPGWTGLAADAARASHERLVERGVIEQTVARDDRQLLLLDSTGGAQPRAAVAVGDVATADHVAVFTPGFTTTVAGALPTTPTTSPHCGRSRATSWRGRPGRDGGGGGLAGLRRAAGRHRPHRRPVGAPLGRGPGRWAPVGGVARRHRHRPRQLPRCRGPPSDRDRALLRLHHHRVRPAGSPRDRRRRDLRLARRLHLRPGRAQHRPREDRGAGGHRGPGRRRRGLRGRSQPAARGGGAVHRAGTAPDGRPLEESAGHSAYLTPGTTSQYNLAATVAGLPEQRITGEHGGLGDLVRKGAQAWAEARL